MDIKDTKMVELLSKDNIGRMIAKKNNICCRMITYAIVGMVIILVLHIVINYNDVIKLNCDGWVLYYSRRCGHCINLMKNTPAIKWAIMNKIDCSDGSKYCPPEIKTVPTWMNKYTGTTWDGVGVFR